MQLAYADWEAALIAATCGLIVIGTIVGNVLVCTAVAIVRRLRTPSNILVLLRRARRVPFSVLYLKVWENGGRKSSLGRLRRSWWTSERPKWSRWTLMWS